MYKRLIAVPFVLGSITPIAGAALSFSFTKDATTAQSDYDNIALPVFTAAGQRWSNLFSNNITINIEIGYRSLGSTGGSLNLGSAQSTSTSASYSSIRSALVAGASGSYDAQAIASLPAGANVDMRINSRTTGLAILDNNGTNNNSLIELKTANAKALGLMSANDPALDASIAFSSDVTWDLNPSDGISSGAYDLTGLATHEIGHAMGFVSNVDKVDRFIPPNGPLKNNTTLRFDNTTTLMTLDLFRFSSESLTMGAGVRDDAAGGNPYFSIDNGLTNLGFFSTGLYNGDGRQASHWKDNLNIGILDPTAATGELLTISNLDIRAFDAIGYTIIPEPAGVSVVLLSALLAGRARRRRTKSFEGVVSDGRAQT